MKSLFSIQCTQTCECFLVVFPPKLPKRDIVVIGIYGRKTLGDDLCNNNN